MRAYSSLDGDVVGVRHGAGVLSRSCAAGSSQDGRLVHSASSAGPRQAVRRNGRALAVRSGRTPAAGAAQHAVGEGLHRAWRGLTALRATRAIQRPSLRACRIFSCEWNACASESGRPRSKASDEKPRDHPGGRSAFEVELAAQPVRDRRDHVGAPGILRPVCHDRDLPGILVRHDRDGEISPQLADVLHLQPDRGLEFFPGFCRLLQAWAVFWLTERNRPIRERMFGAIVIDNNSFSAVPRHPSLRASLSDNRPRRGGLRRGRRNRERGPGGLPFARHSRLPGGGNPLSSVTNFLPTPVPAAEAFLGGLVGPGRVGDQAVQRHPRRIPAFHGLATDRAFEARDLPHFAMCSVRL
jgi:hypothetical protein